MIDREKRNRLLVMLRQLGSGALPIDDFERIVEAHQLHKSLDRSLAHLLSFASSFYDDDLAFDFPTRFRGKHRLKPADRKRIAIAVLFLKSDCEFRWPDDYNQPYLHDCMFLLLCATTVCASVATLALSILSVFWLPVGIALVLVSIWLFRYARQYNAWAYERWKSRELIEGRNCDMWPFVNEQEFNEALAHPWLLASG